MHVTHVWLTLLVLGAWQVLLSQGSPFRRRARQAGDSFDGNRFLEKFGYLDDLPNQNHSPDSVLNALREFQRFNGLPVTGRMDRRTVTKMQSPRCGIPDVIKPSERPSNLRDRDDTNAPLAFHAPGFKWENKAVTYKVMGYTRRLGGQQQIDAYVNAFRKWSDVTPLTFTSTSGDANILISYARREHGDGPANAFDGRGGTLAHAYFPGPQPIAGDTHFDDDEEWTVGTDRGTNLEIVAAHEFGHALGLGHSSNPRALMAPFYSGYDPNYALHDDDIQGIQSLYGSRTGYATTAPTTLPPRTPRTTTEAPTGAHCSVRFDAIEQVHDGTIYAFRQRDIYKITEQGPVEKRLLRAVFRGAPSNPGGVVYDRRSGKLFIFKGKRYWRFTGYEKDTGYPKTLPTDFQKPSAAMVWRDGGIYLFRGSDYMRWQEGLAGYSSGFPRKADDYWRGMPVDVGAAFRSYDGYYYAFKGLKYWRFNSQAALSPGYPKDIRPVWLNCGRPSEMTANALELSYLTSEINEADTSD